MNDSKTIVIFASGNGSNAERIIQYFSESPTISIKAVCTNNPRAGVIDKVAQHDIPIYIFNKNELYETEEVLFFLKSINPSLIILAGFILKIPLNILEAFPNKIINVHPSLLPKFGGAGMYGLNVHNAVLETGEKESGVTIHYVNVEYDRGEIIFQKECSVVPDETPESLAEKVHALEHYFLPRIIEELLLKPVSGA